MQLVNTQNRKLGFYLLIGKVNIKYGYKHGTKGYKMETNDSLTSKSLAKEMGLVNMIHEVKKKKKKSSGSLVLDSLLIAWY